MSDTPVSLTAGLPLPAQASPSEPKPKNAAEAAKQFEALMIAQMLRTVEVVPLHHAESILPCYMKALETPRSTILVEFTEHYKNQRGETK